MTVFKSSTLLYYLQSIDGMMKTLIKYSIERVLWQPQSIMRRLYNTNGEFTGKASANRTCRIKKIRIRMCFPNTKGWGHLQTFATRQIYKVIWIIIFGLCHLSNNAFSDWKIQKWVSVISFKNELFIDNLLNRSNYQQVFHPRPYDFANP